MRLAAILFAVAVSFTLFTRAALRNTTELDPLDQRYSDHLRSRYCAALVFGHPLENLTRPMSEAAASDTRAQKHVLWGELPCHQPGIVFILFHAPAQWLIDAGALDEAEATKLTVLLLLALAHAASALLLLSPRWWAGLVFYPFALRCALNALQEPLPIFLALLAGLWWSAGKRLRALLFVALAFSAYNRWGLWLLAFAWLCWRERAELLAELRSGAGRALAAVCALLVSWSLIGTALAASAWHLPASKLGAGEYVALFLALAFSIAAWWKTRDSRLAPVLVLTLLFLVAYRSLLPYWYLSPVLPAIALARHRHEAALWAVIVLVLPDAVFHQGVWPSAATRLVLSAF